MSRPLFLQGKNFFSQDIFVVDSVSIKKGKGTQDS
jgi:hypothetical protein